MKISELVNQLQSAMEITGDVDCYVDIMINDGTMVQTSTIDRVTMYGPMNSEGHIDGGTLGIVGKLNIMGSIDTRNFIAKQFNDIINNL